jgi:hypothetical protein
MEMLPSGVEWEAMVQHIERNMQRANEIHSRGIDSDKTKLRGNKRYRKMPAVHDENTIHTNTTPLLRRSRCRSVATTHSGTNRRYEELRAAKSYGLHNISGHNHCDGWVCVVWSQLSQPAHSNKG